MSEAQIRAYVIADNRLAENAGWDRALLGLELQYLCELDIDFDVTVTGFELPEIDVLIGELSLAGNDNDAADAPFEVAAGPAVSRLGDVRARLNDAAQGPGRDDDIEAMFVQRYGLSGGLYEAD
jgi:hypothetical protein